MKGRKTGICLPFSFHSSLCGKAEEIFFFSRKKSFERGKKNLCESSASLSFDFYSSLSRKKFSHFVTILLFFSRTRKKKKISRKYSHLSPPSPYFLQTEKRAKGKEGRKEGKAPNFGVRSAFFHIYLFPGSHCEQKRKGKSTGSFWKEVTCRSSVIRIKSFSFSLLAAEKRKK